VEFSWLATPVSPLDRAIADARTTPVSPSSHIRLNFVRVADEAYSQAYDGIATRMFYFLQHNLWDLPTTPLVDDDVYDAWENGFRGYARSFATAIGLELKRSPDSIVMLHDPHMYLVAEMIREEHPSATITHFSNIPWPDVRQWLLLPARFRRETITGLLAADIVGFQTARDAANFLHCVRDLIPEAKVNSNAAIVRLGKRVTFVRRYPIAIDVAATRQMSMTRECRQLSAQLRTSPRQKLIVRVDRLDPSKNILRGFAAFELLLKRNPRLIGHVTFVAILPPSRSHLSEYRRYATLVRRQVQRINALFGSDPPVIRAFYEHHRGRALAALAAADVVLVNSLVDGMNLVAKEAIAVNRRSAGLVLSETVGAFDQLRFGAYAVAPTDIAGTADALAEVLSSSRRDRESRLNVMRSVAEREDLTWWWHQQIRDLANIPFPRARA
jgi:trehalose 6-phosphate synthase